MDKNWYKMSAPGGIHPQHAQKDVASDPCSILDVKLKNSSTRYLYNFDDRELVEALINLSPPFKDATEFMSSKTMPTSG